MYSLGRQRGRHSEHVLWQRPVSVEEEVQHANEQEHSSVRHGTHRPKKATDPEKSHTIPIPTKKLGKFIRELGVEVYAEMGVSLCEGSPRCTV